MTRYAVTIALCLSVSPLACGAASATQAAMQQPKADVGEYARNLMDRRYAADGPGGAVLVARGDQILFRAARGQADLERGRPLRPDSLFRIGSVTKQFAAAGLLKLVEAGTVQLSDPLSKYLPGYPGGDAITVLQLLNHTSGVKNYTAIRGYMDEPVRRDLSTAQMIDVFKDEKPDFPPGEGWNYSNSGYVLVGAVIEAASGQPWHAYLERALFKPLGMKDTGYAHDPRRVARQVRGYSFDGEKPVPARAISMTQPHAAGSLLSNADDLLKWNRALHEGKVLKSAAYRRMITPAGKAEGPGYGFGIFTGKVRDHASVWHGGGIFGFISALSYVPGPDVSVVVLENDDQDNDRRGGESADSFARRLAAAALGEPYPELRAVPADAAALKSAEGVYRFEGDVTRVLRVADGKLTAVRGSRGEPAMLTPIGPDEFLYEDGFNRLKLERDAGGNVKSARIFPDGDGPGEVGIRTTDPLPSAPAGLRLPRAALERVAGTYAHAEAGLTLKVYLEGAALLAQIAGQDPVTLRAKSPVEFDVEESPASVEFSPGAGPAAQVTMKQGGREIVLKRTP